jgi:hypothetical protein
MSADCQVVVSRQVGFKQCQRRKGREAAAGLRAVSVVSGSEAMGSGGGAAAQ